MKERDQRKNPRRRPYKRKLHFSEHEVWSYRFANGVVAIRTPDLRTTHQIPVPKISGMSWDDMERGIWKQWWTGVGPQKIKDYIDEHLRHAA